MSVLPSYPSGWYLIFMHFPHKFNYGHMVAANTYDWKYHLNTLAHQCYFFLSLGTYLNVQQHQNLGTYLQCSQTSPKFACLFNIYNGWNSCPNLLQTASLHALTQNLWNFTLHNNDHKCHNYPSPHVLQWLMPSVGILVYWMESLFCSLFIISSIVIIGTRFCCVHIVIILLVHDLRLLPWSRWELCSSGQLHSE